MSYKRNGISSIKLCILYSIQQLKPGCGLIVIRKIFAESSGQLIGRD